MHSVDIENRRITTRDAASTSHRWWTLAAVCTGVFMLLLDITIVNVALPDIEKAFGASLSDLQWVISAYALTLAAFLLTAGSLADLYGRRLLFAIGITIFTTGSLFCGLATGSLFLTISRGAQGVGGAIMFATSLALLAQTFQGRDRGVALGLFGAITGIAVAIGPVLGGAITTGLSWRWIFYVNIPIGIVALLDHAAACRGVAQPERHAARLGRLRHIQRRSRGARVRPDREPAQRLGLGHGDRVAGGERRAARRVRHRSSASSPSRCSTWRSCACRPSSAGWRRPGRSRPPSSRCSPI